MSAFYDQASLVVVPSGYKSGKIYAQKPLTTDGQLTFTRASTATRVNASGLIEEVASGVPRLDYLGSSCPKILLEPQRTNIAQHSQSFDNAFWLKLGTGLTVTANTTISPDGTQNADTLNVSNNDNVLYSSRSGTLSGNTYTFSIYAKGTGTFVMNIRLNSSTSTTETKTLTSQWQRFTVSVTNAVPVVSVEFFLDLNTSSTYNVWGAQVEQGTYLTSYIPTTSADVTRVADAASKTGISSLIGSTAGTLFFEGTVNTNGEAADVFLLYNSSNVSLGAYLVGFNTSGNITLYALPSASLHTLKSGDNRNTRVKIALAYQSGDLVAYVNGVQTFSSAGISLAAGLSALFLNSNNIPANYGIGTYNQALLFKTRLTNAQLAELTTL
jgi:hypothetical protein